MKYFTKDWFDEMQIISFLLFPDTLQEWEEELAYYRADGRDLEEINRRNLEESRADLLKFLPEPFHPYIHDGTLAGGLPPQELRDMAVQWLEESDARTEALEDEYNRHYESIKGQLPAGAVQLVEQSLHDATVISVEKTSDGVLIIQLDCRDCFHYFTDVQLTFTGVREADIPEDFEDAWWLYEELYLTNHGFELHVLFDEPRAEVKIVAQDVKIEVLE